MDRGMVEVLVVGWMDGFFGICLVRWMDDWIGGWVGGQMVFMDG